MLSFSSEGRDREETLGSAQTVFGRVLGKNFRFLGSKILVRNATKGVGLKVKGSELDLKLEVCNVRVQLRV